MYNGIGLQTARGSGTNGYVQTNKANLLLTKKKTSYNTEADILRAEAELNRPPNKDLLEHNKKRHIEVKCADFEILMEDKGFPLEAIERKVNEYRNLLIEQVMSGELDLEAEMVAKDTHGKAQAAIHNRERMRAALGIDSKFVDGSSFEKMNKKEDVGLAEKEGAEESKEGEKKKHKKDKKSKKESKKHKKHRAPVSSSDSDSSTDSDSSSDGLFESESDSTDKEADAKKGRKEYRSKEKRKATDKKRYEKEENRQGCEKAGSKADEEMPIKRRRKRSGSDARIRSPEGRRQPHGERATEQRRPRGESDEKKKSHKKPEINKTAKSVHSRRATSTSDDEKQKRHEKHRSQKKTDAPEPKRRHHRNPSPDSA